MKKISKNLAKPVLESLFNEHSIKIKREITNNLKIQFHPTILAIAEDLQEKYTLEVIEKAEEKRKENDMEMVKTKVKAKVKANSDKDNGEGKCGKVSDLGGTVARNRSLFKWGFLGALRNSYIITIIALYLEYLYIPGMVIFELFPSGFKASEYESKNWTDVYYTGWTDIAESTMTFGYWYSYLRDSGFAIKPNYMIFSVRAALPADPFDDLAIESAFDELLMLPDPSTADSSTHLAAEPALDPSPTLPHPSAADPSNHLAAEPALDPSPTLPDLSAADPSNHLAAEPALDPSPTLPDPSAADPSNHLSVEPALDPPPTLPDPSAADPSNHLSVEPALDPPSTFSRADGYSTGHIVRRSNRDSSGAYLYRADVQLLLHKIRTNDPDTVVLKVKNHLGSITRSPEVSTDESSDEEEPSWPSLGSS